MGYAGYVPAKLATTRSALQQSLQAIDDADALDVLGKLIRNAVVSPSEAKFRTVKLSNPRVKAACEAGGLQVLLQIGWQQQADNADLLILPPGARVTMAEVREVQDAQDALRKSQRLSARNLLAKKNTDAERAHIRAAMEADRLERAARGMGERGSAAQHLGQGVANVSAAGDAGPASG